MKQRIFVTVVFVAALAVAVMLNTAPDGEQTVTVRDDKPVRPLVFSQNTGQWDEQVLFRTRAGLATVWITTEGLHYQFARRLPGEEKAIENDKPGRRDRYDRASGELSQMAIKASFVGANPNPEVAGLSKLGHKSNYFLGNDKSRWQTNVPNYAAVLLREVYPGIDLKYYSNPKGKLEYDFIASPGADISKIQVRYEGAKSVAINDAGDLEVETDWNILTEARPIVYQLADGERHEVAGEYRLLADNTFGFELGANYDAASTVVIDPTLDFSTYLGGDSADLGTGIAVDESGVYITGLTKGGSFPTENAYDNSHNGGYDVFVTKFSSHYDSIIFSTFIGGSGDELSDILWGFGGMAIDTSGAVYIKGTTQSSDFPTVNAIDTSLGGSEDGFVAKLSSSGDSLIYSTYLGGDSVDACQGIAVDGSGAAYVVGSTKSPNFPTKGAYDTALGGTQDAFITKLSANGDSLIYSTYLGGTNLPGYAGDYGNAIAIDSAGAVYVTGFTYSMDFPTTAGAFDTSNVNGTCDIFITKLSSSGDSLVYSTFLGSPTTADDDGYAIAVDDSGYAYVTGATWGVNFPVKNAFQSSKAGGWFDGFITKLSIAGDSLIYSTYLGGGSDLDQCYGIAVDVSGEVHVAGITGSPDFPTADRSQLFGNAFVASLSRGGDSLIYGTHLGGNSGEGGGPIALDDSGAVYVTGVAGSGFPMAHAYDSTLGGSMDAFVAKLIPGSCECICGDADNSGSVNVADLTYLVDYFFRGGPAPPIDIAADMDCSGAVDVADMTYLNDYLNSGGPDPCDPDDDGSPNCS